MRTTSWIVALGALVLLPGGLLSGQGPARPDPDARAAERIRALQREAESLASQERSLLGELRRLEVERDLRLEESRRLDAQAAELEAQIAAVGRQTEETRAAIEAARPALDARLVEVYKLGRPGYARMLLGVDNMRDAARMARLAGALASMDHRRVADQVAAARRLATGRVELEQRSAQLASVQASAKLAAGQARASAEARATLIQQIDARRDLTARMVGELEVARERLKSVVPGSAAGAALLPLKPFRGTLEWPVDGRVASRFGSQRNPRFGTSVVQSGIEVEAPDGEPVRTVHEGRVAFADVFAGFGQLVIVDHGNLGYSLYGYLGSITVQKGAALAAGQAVGSVGRSPSGNPALYFELRVDGKPVDPLEWLKRQATARRPPAPGSEDRRTP